MSAVVAETDIGAAEAVHHRAQMLGCFGVFHTQPEIVFFRTFHDSGVPAHAFFRRGNQSRSVGDVGNARGDSQIGAGFDLPAVVFYHGFGFFAAYPDVAGSVAGQMDILNGQADIFTKSDRVSQVFRIIQAHEFIAGLLDQIQPFFLG